MKNSAAKKLKQVPTGYLVVGVDPHEKKHSAVAIAQDFTTQSKYKFSNSRQGFREALERAIRTASSHSSSLGLNFFSI